MDVRTVGVEEEFLLVDPTDGRARANAAAVLRADHQAPVEVLEAELQQQQVETGTHPCTSLDELAEEVRSARRRASDAARSIGAEIAAIGTSPLPVHAEISPSPRYRQMAQRFGMTALEQLTCGCHVHVSVGSDDEGVGVLDRIRPWLPPLLALSVNSPFWQGEDSGYASYRSRVWSRWPGAGATEAFGSAAAYHETVRTMTGTDTVLDRGMIYFDARLSHHYPTVEVRVADVCLAARDAVLVASLTRALVETAARAHAAGTPTPPARVELLDLASWRAARSGLSGDLLDPRTWQPAPARAVLEVLLEHVRDALEDAGEYPAVTGMVRDLAGRGTGAQRQRAVHDRTGSLVEVVTHAVRHTRED